MSAIYGSTKTYDESIFRKKMDIAAFRGKEYTNLRRYRYDTKELFFGFNSSDVKSDCSPNQPFEDQNDISVVFDGMISNKKELRLQFNLDEEVSDVGLICDLYRKFETKSVEYINGVFAFVLYDAHKQILFGARDRMGLKPMFFHYGTDGFEFSSQLFPLCIGNQYHINATGRQYYFAMQYIPEPISIISEVLKLRAGECFEYSIETNRLNVWTYWDIHDKTCHFEVPKTYEETVKVAKDLIEESVENCINNEKNNCTFLSGGIDSSLVTAVAFKLNPRIETFSMGFEDVQYDESEYSKKVAETLGIKHNHIICSTDEVLKTLENLQIYYDEPMGDYSSIPTSLLSQKARERCSVALGGDGGDEVFFGYPRYLRYASRDWVYKVPKVIRQGAADIADIAGRHRLALSLRLDNVYDLYINRRVYCPAEKFDSLALQQNMSDYHYLTEVKDVRKAFNDYDMKTLMVNAYNVKVERAAARAGLDFYTPLLDYRLTEFTRILPIEYLYSPKDGQKRILRTLLEEYYPRELFERKKRGFAPPLTNWFRHELRDFLLDTLNEDTVELLPDYDPKKLLEMRDEHIRGFKDYTTYLWLCVNYIEWYNLFKKVTDN